MKTLINVWKFSWTFVDTKTKLKLLAIISYKILIAIALGYFLHYSLGILFAIVALYIEYKYLKAKTYQIYAEVKAEHRQEKLNEIAKILKRK